MIDHPDCSTKDVSAAPFVDPGLGAMELPRDLAIAKGAKFYVK